MDFININDMELSFIEKCLKKWVLRTYIVHRMNPFDLRVYERGYNKIKL